jgi:hypothetical protein
MARFDIRSYPAGGKLAPFVVELQSDAWDDVLDTKVVAPLRPIRLAARDPEKICPRIDHAGNLYVLAIPEMAAVLEGSLGPVTGTAASSHFAIVNAIDSLLQGF